MVLAKDEDGTGPLHGDSCRRSNFLNLTVPLKEAGDLIIIKECMAWVRTAHAGHVGVRPGVTCSSRVSSETWRLRDFPLLGCFGGGVHW